MPTGGEADWTAGSEASGDPGVRVGEPHAAARMATAPTIAMARRCRCPPQGSGPLRSLIVRSFERLGTWASRAPPEYRPGHGPGARAGWPRAPPAAMTGTPFTPDAAGAHVLPQSPTGVVVRTIDRARLGGRRENRAWRKLSRSRDPVIRDVPPPGLVREKAVRCQRPARRRRRVRESRRCPGGQLPERLPNRASRSPGNWPLA
jgi:hypothetical protein